MSWASDLTKRILADATVQASIEGRFYPDEAAPDATDPYAVSQVISDPPAFHLGGEDNVRQAQWQVTCWARTSLAARAGADAIGARLKDFTGVEGSTQFLRIRRTQAGIDLSTPASDGSGVGLKGRLCEYEVTYLVA